MKNLNVSTDKLHSILKKQNKIVEEVRKYLASENKLSAVMAKRRDAMVGLYSAEKRLLYSYAMLLDHTSAKFFLENKIRLLTEYMQGDGTVQMSPDLTLDYTKPEASIKDLSQELAEVVALRATRREKHTHRVQAMEEKRKEYKRYMEEENSAFHSVKDATMLLIAKEPRLWQYNQKLEIILDKLLALSSHCTTGEYDALIEEICAKKVLQSTTCGMSSFNCAYSRIEELFNPLRMQEEYCAVKKYLRRVGAQVKELRSAKPPGAEDGIAYEIEFAVKQAELANMLNEGMRKAQKFRKRQEKLERDLGELIERIAENERRMAAGLPAPQPRPSQTRRDADMESDMESARVKKTSRIVMVLPLLALTLSVLYVFFQHSAAWPLDAVMASGW